MINLDRTRTLLQNFDFKTLFIEELGWDRHDATLEISVEEKSYTLTAIAEKRGLGVFVFTSPGDHHFPDYALRRKIERQVARSVHEHLVIYIDTSLTIQVWQWVKRETGKPTACREHAYHRGQTGEALIQRLQNIVFSLEEEERLSLPEVTIRTRAAFDLERVTKRFYDRFKTELAGFLKFIKNIPGAEMLRWYASVMLNRLMFIYFIQKKGFLNDDVNYLRNKLSQSRYKGQDRFYADFLCLLFFEGFAKPEKERSPETNQLVEKVPFLNGGIFLRHQIEELYGQAIKISDLAFENLFDFFDQYQWHLDERPLRADNEINPDVLGYIFEKYINQKQMGAYYTKEDITEYISKNTVIPRIFDTARQKCKIAFEGDQSIWRLLQSDPNRYIYDAVKKGVDIPLPQEIAVGFKDVAKRTEWNKPASPGHALPTEIWREVVARRERYGEVYNKLAKGEIYNINDLITYNLNIRQFSQDVIENCEGPELLRAFYHAIEKVTILDPTCGSGAFLFAALNILESLYEACLDRMQVFLEELDSSGQKHRPEKFSDFRKILEQINRHPNRRYFILKSIIINNLFGVDIMKEAVEICKLRLFLKLVAQVEKTEHIEPLPDIDFNIRAGNTLVGFATYDEVKEAVNKSAVTPGKLQGKLLFDDTMQRIDEKAEDVDRLFDLFRQQQTEIGGEVTSKDKQNLQTRLKALEDELNIYLAREYGIKVPSPSGRGIKGEGAEYEKWLASHKPFHWFIEFYGIMKNGGFDVIIGNPPYVEYSKIRNEYTVRGYETESCGNLYAFTIERAMNLLHNQGSFGLIVPISLVCTQRMEKLQEVIARYSQSVWFSNYAERPSKLFVGAEVLLTITFTIAGKKDITQLFTTDFIKWSSDERSTLFDRIGYCPVETKFKPYVIPKMGAPFEASILRKLTAQGRQLDRKLRSNSKYPIYYRIGGGRYWKIFTNFQPRFILNGNQSVSSRENYLYLETKTHRDCIISVLSSSLFYWYFILTTNCRDLNPIDLNGFPINLDQLSDKHTKILEEFCHKLMEDYRGKSQLKEKTSSLTGNIIYQEFYPRLSKPLIDEIDGVLAEHYCFTDEELDFIINYDIKYRMGREGGDNDSI
jgi:Eco57I restriction endonuclease.